ncbi:MAG: surface lipoprotein assembly modifier [Gammaproteobacteria bacterium]
MLLITIDRAVLRRVSSVFLALLIGAMSWQAEAAEPTAQTPDPNQVLFEQGMQALHGDQLFSAMEAFQQILSSAPGLHRARLELAVAYYRALDYAKARAEAQRVLKDPHVPPNVRVSILAFLAQVNEDQKKLAVPSHFTPFVSVGAMYDSNVNVGPVSDIVQSQGRVLTVLPGSLPKSDSAVVLSAGVTHRYQPGRRFRSGQQVGQFLWQSELDAYQRSYFQQHAYNLSVLSASTGPAWVVLRHWRAAVPLQLDYIWLGGHDLALFSSLNPRVTWQLPRAEVSLDGTLAKRHYRDNRPTDQGGNAGHDGVYRRAGVSYAHYFNERKVAVQAGVDWYDFSADDAQFGYSGPGGYLATFVRAWSGGTVYGRVYYNDLKYDGIDTLGVVRDEQEREATVGVEHRFTAGRLEKWSLNGSFRYTDNRSNDPVYRYRRRQLNLTLSRNF